MSKYINKIFFKSSTDMTEIPDNSVDLVITSPPYFNIKDYSKDGTQSKKHSTSSVADIGSLNDYDKYIKKLLTVGKECHRVLKPNGKLCVNVPLLPMLKSELNTHHNRHIFDIQSDIQNSILKSTNFDLLDIYIGRRTNSTKRLMFGSYPYPGNFYAQNIIEFITVYVKRGAPAKIYPAEIKEKSKLSKNEWLEFTKQIGDIAIPNRGDEAFGQHPALMTEEIVHRLVRLFSFGGDIVLDPFAGSGTTLKIALQNGRKYIGYEIYNHYDELISKKLATAKIGFKSSRLEEDSNLND